MINPLFLPNEDENNLIQIIQKYHRGEFALIRLTGTMYKKSIIDASQPIRSLLLENELFDYYSDTLIQGEIYSLEGIILSSIPKDINVSAYRPCTKKGDPRFWLYNLKSYADPNDLIYITVSNSKIIAIPLNKGFNKDIISNTFDVFNGQSSKDTDVINELVGLLRKVKSKGFIPSMSTKKKNDKDVGETLELELGLSINNLVSADYKGEIEIKCKREQSSTDDTLFCKVPNWKISTEKSLRDIVLKYGYLDRKYENCTSLFVDVSTKPNPQGLFLDFDDENELLNMFHTDGKSITSIASWNYSTLKTSLFNKHPKTAWIVAEENIIDGKIHFCYKSFQLTQNPIFSQFISLMKQNLIVFSLASSFYNFGEKYGKNRTDNGQSFRLKPNNRHKLFGDTQTIEL